MVLDPSPPPLFQSLLPVTCRIQALQHTATHCHILQHKNCDLLRLFFKPVACEISHTYTHIGTATYCNTTNTLQQPTATYCNTILHTYTHIGTATHYYKIPRHTATQPNTLQHTATQPNTLQHPTATYCNTTQHTATYCNTTQHTATSYCNILQHNPTHCNTRIMTCFDSFSSPLPFENILYSAKHESAWPLRAASWNKVVALCSFFVTWQVGCVCVCVRESERVRDFFFCNLKDESVRPLRAASWNDIVVLCSIL